MEDNKKHEHDDAGHPQSGYGMYLVTWLSLLVLTAVTVTAAGMSLGAFSVAMALLIASVKASVVLSFFMHLKYESTIFKVFFFVAIATFAIFIGITFVDIPFR